MTKWSEYYKKEIEKAGGPKEFVIFKAKEKRELINEILKHTRRGGIILEAGCGTGAISSYISSLGYGVIAIDHDKQMIKLARQLSKSFNSKVNFAIKNIKDIKYPKNYFDVVFSHGVLEHFSDKEIINLINIELNSSKTVILSVPSNYFTEEQKIYGDERFLGIGDWEKILQRTNGLLIDKFGYYFQNSFYRFANQIFKNVFIHKAPYIGFVIKSRTK